MRVLGCDVQDKSEVFNISPIKKNILESYQSYQCGRIKLGMNEMFVHEAKHTGGACES